MTQLSRTWTDVYTVCLGYKETTVGSFKGQRAALPIGPSHTPCYLGRNERTSLAASQQQNTKGQEFHEKIQLGLERHGEQITDHFSLGFLF